jgi:hypothetical protein
MNVFPRARQRAMPAIAMWATAVVMTASATCALAGNVRLEVGPLGATRVLDRPIVPGVNNSNLPYMGNQAGGAWDGYAEGVAYTSGNAGVIARISGTTAALAQASVDNNHRSYVLRPPQGVNFAGGKLVVYAGLTGGDIRGNASLEFKLEASAFKGSWPDSPSASAQRTVNDQPGGEAIELSARVDLPAYLDSTSTVNVELGILLKANANIAPAGGNVQSASAEAIDGGKITGFRVLNAAGTQLTGFKLNGSSNIVELAPSQFGRGQAIEFYNPAFRHFFITADAAEIAALTNGNVWTPTGESFGVYTTLDAGRVGVCRFFGVFPQPGAPAKSSHFYALRGLGCEALLANPGPWGYEGDVFFMPPPDASGACPSGTAPVYRLYNNGMGGAPNHRYTTSEKTAAEMVRDGYVSEGAGAAGVAVCSPQ